MTIRYDGTRYSGWQFQKNAKTIQEVLERALKKILGKKIKLKGAGRTDAGVHAEAQVANFKTLTVLPLKRIIDALNSNLPNDILVSSAQIAPPGFDAQRSAKSKHYRYAVTTSRFVDPFLRHFVAKYSYSLNIGAMRRAAGLLEGRHDFKGFQASGSAERSTVRRIRKIGIEKAGDLVYIDMWADGFLYNMARAIAGTLLEIGRGKIAESRIKEILSKRERRLAGPTVPAKGLCLVRVEY